MLFLVYFINVKIKLKSITFPFYLTGQPPASCAEKIDHGFLLYNAHSIDPNLFDIMKTFIKDLYGSFKISQDCTRVSLISYALTSTLHFSFSKIFPSKDDLDSELHAISTNHRFGAPNVEEALVKANEEMFISENGARLSGV